MSNSLAAMHPELVREWSDKNLPLTPDKITYGSNVCICSAFELFLSSCKYLKTIYKNLLTYYQNGNIINTTHRYYQFDNMKNLLSHNNRNGGNNYGN